MGGFLDEMRSIKAGLKSGPTEPGAWRQMESFGRFNATGELEVELELPEVDPVAISIEEFRDVETLEFELRGPDGTPLELKRYSAKNFDNEQAVHNLHRIATGKVPAAGLHRLRVKAPDPEMEMLIVVGEELTATGALKDFGEEMIPGRKLWKRLRGEG